MSLPIPRGNGTECLQVLQGTASNWHIHMDCNALRGQPTESNTIGETMVDLLLALQGCQHARSNRVAEHANLLHIPAQQDFNDSC